ncbi:MAG TPA: hypothetical protein DCR14_05855 [Acidimicrobiaceae bacterium]|nr:hypothetical protein [Acidimicrobiaceae bacterium]
MSLFDRTVADWFHDHHGIVNGHELRRLGITDDQRDFLVRRQVLIPLFESVYRLASTPLSFHGRCRAVCAADGSLVLSCFTAGTLFELRRCNSLYLHVVTQRLTKPVGPTVKVHRTRLDLSAHIIERADGIRHTDAAQTWFDLAKHVSDVALLSITEQIIADGLATHEELMTRAVEIARRGRPGASRALRVIGARPTAGKAADSDDEVVLLEALHRAGLTMFVRHPPVTLRNGTPVHPDLGVPEWGFYVEVDHPTWHAAQEQSEYDKARDIDIRLTGAEVVRVPSSRIRSSLDAVVADLATLAHRRRRVLNIGARTAPDAA